MKRGIYNRKGFTLIELLVSLIIFTFMLTTLSTVYITANNYFYQRYREDLWKNRLTLATKFIKNKLVTATEIQLPWVGSNSNDLFFFSNFTRLPPPVSSSLGCRPDINNTSTWHYFCLSGNLLYYHTGVFNGGNCATNSVVSLPSPPPCGAAGGTIVLSNLVAPNIGLYSTTIFGRQNLPNNIVRVTLRLFWQANYHTGEGDYSKVARDIDTTNEFFVAINRPPQW
ncbi:MAG: prepilin-type N-terminal cleavage/methylation domain-containing protein [Elusimicrobiales bacterium]|nr:prepilin-type N-terminal cleavage/methylation domain-containing protein [Elusimicrobiales bacterium]